MRFTTQLLLLILCNCLFFSGVLQAQNKFTADVYNADLGLPSNHVESCTADSVGFLWVATRRGICRYDGYNFKPYPAVRGNILSMYNAGNNGLVYYTNTGGLARFNPYKAVAKQIATTQFRDSDPSNDHYNNIFVDNAGRIWCCDFAHVKYYSARKKAFKSYALIDYDSTTDRLATFTQFKNGEVWIASIFGMKLWNEKTGQLTQSRIQLLNNLNFSTSARIGHDSLLLAAGNSLILVQPSTQTILSTANTNITDAIVSITTSYINGKKYVVLASSDKVYTLSNPSAHLTEIFNMRPYGGIINSIYCVRQNGFIWVNSSQGLIKLTPPADAIVNIPVTPLIGNAGESAITQVVKQRNGKGYFVNTSIGECYFTYLDGYWEKLPVAARVNHIVVYGTKLLIATSVGLYVYDGGKVIKVVKIPGIKKVLEAGGYLWLLLDNGPVLVLNKVNYSLAKNWPVKNSPVFAKENLWNDIYATGRGEVYLAGWMRSGFGLAVYDKLQSTFVPISGRTKNENMFIGDYYNHIAPSKKFNLLFSGYGGFNTVNPQGQVTRIISINDHNLANEHVEGIAEMPDGRIWFGTEEGVQVWNPKTDELTLVTTQNGLPSNNAIYGFDLINDNVIAIGFNKAISLLYTGKVFKSTLQNKLVVSSLHVNGKNREVIANKITVSPSERNLQMAFSTLDFADTRKITYLYSINNGEWSTLGNNPILTFSNFKPGKYAITVKAVDNLSNQQTKQLLLYVLALPAFYETIWFVIVITAAVVSLVWLFFAFRLRQLKKIGKFRSAISQDLHDDVGATLSSINILSGMLKDETRLPEKSALYLQRINTDVQQLQVKLDEIIWSLKKEENSLQQIFVKLVNYGYVMMEARDIAFEHYDEMGQQEKTLSYQINRNLYLLVKEALNNIAKHSNATAATLLFKLQKKLLVITITDNGLGIPPERMHKRNGISGMGKRAEEIGARIQINTGNNKGTEIVVEIKL
ncbi:sensor histidine kinase [Mucilaginibacter psychrotolerans]|uniref:Histidine kinase domain-containing protein n=1 Tax=Mucilaginibacter psychrotolerans TaxID=1524096 RepID=A0A4Y8SD53_9SPHI|nr:sensor histidine kinase [Mucilaginibacter psychrotolerans]TFF36591.1 hypothetical protein E2R66_15670 [Mucilaginibacter psychrotolerans]